jgi:hypothetical protein
MERPSTASIKFAGAFLAVIFAVQVYRAATQPIGSVEAYSYDRFVRPTTRQVLAQELLNRDVLYSLLEKRSVGLFHVSPFSVRLPSLLFATLYLWLAWRLGQLLFGSGPVFLLWVLLSGLVPLRWDIFSTANGLGAPFALDLFAVHLAIEYLICNKSINGLQLNLSGACLGLSVAACLDFAIPAAALAFGFLVALVVIRRQWVEWANRVLVPAVVVGLVFLVLPLSHAHAAPEITPDLSVEQAAQIRSAFLVLRDSAADHRVSIAASLAVEPILNFYRAQYRLTTWDRVERNLVFDRFDYYLLATMDEGLVDQRHLIVLYRDPDFVLARRSYDSK